MVLTIEELLSAAIEALKVSIAINYARLVVSVEDEEGNPLDQETIDEELAAIFHEITDEVDQTLQQVLARMAQAKAEATSGLEIVRDPRVAQAVKDSGQD